ncbi:uncharacterized protein BXZ73DRAFT_96230 [Epithele typhae]|uniref:uncharacterized protein n=1 Tax=Epithele typhae TaxID=378194 RepID=UPI00200829BF|nr:uncharacterized protein BXZ73DRAFT_96230 [Epithele typhae]KAH9945239.1 hypothetical protein BXZ73DRAFT_96230 [Epithele typhae]
MHFITAVTVVAALAAHVVLGQPLTVNTLSGAVQCEPVQFTWAGGAPPYFLALNPAGQANAPALKQFPVQNGQSMTWIVDMASGSSFSTVLKDSTGAQAFSDIVTIQPNSDDSCLHGGQTASAPMSQNSGSAGSIAATTPAPTPSNNGAAAGQKAVTSSTSGTTALSSGTSAPSGSATRTALTTSSNAASNQAYSGAIGIAGLLGLAGAALLG